MANVAAMGPPPSPKEPRRSGRRSVPAASTSKSPTGSPTTESTPKAKDSQQRPPPPSTASSSRSKRTKNEEVDEPIDEPLRNGTNGATNGRAKRKGKEKEKLSLTVDIPTDGDSPHGRMSTAGVDAEEEEEEEQGITRCICQETGVDGAQESDWMAECDGCHAWQHGACMGFKDEDGIPALYYCEKCRPDLYPDLLKKHHARRARQSSASHHATTNAARNSRSHSPTYLLKQPPKRRNTMNSRDAAYELEVQMLLEATKVEAAAEASVIPQEPLVASPPTMNGQAAEVDDKSRDAPEQEVDSSNGRKKRKRSSDDSVPTKRPRSVSIVSDRTHVTNAAPEASPTVTTKPILPTTVSVASNSTAKAGRAKRGGARKAQVQDVIPADGEEAAATTRRQGNNRSKATAAHEHATRRTQVNGINGHGPSSSTTATSRAYHHSHAYAASQQPLFTSWNLPDYLSHLEPMLPTEVPRPLEVRGFGAPAAGLDPGDRTTERGVKVKWPSKRMSVVDMNKRVRSLVEWVGREQANSAERNRRREAVEKALRELREGRHDLPQHEQSYDVPMLEDGAGPEHPRDGEAPGQPLVALEGPGPDSALSTMKMMEQLMEELISFQERFGPGAKMKERERRTTTS